MDMVVIFYLWLLGALCSFSYFSYIGSKECQDSFDVLIMSLFNLIISAVWFIYIPYLKWGAHETM